MNAIVLALAVLLGQHWDDARPMPGKDHATIAASKYTFVVAKACPMAADVPKDCHVVDGAPSCAPGDVETNDLDVICHMPTAMRRCTFSKSIRRGLLKAYGVKSACELDHRISLELGGSNALSNIWPQQRNCKQKDRQENELHRAVCSGELSLEAARYLLLHSWEEAPTGIVPVARRYAPAPRKSATLSAR